MVLAELIDRGLYIAALPGIEDPGGVGDVIRQHHRGVRRGERRTEDERQQSENRSDGGGASPTPNGSGGCPTLLYRGQLREVWCEGHDANLSVVARRHRR